MWPPELIGFLHAMACTDEGRKALLKVDESGIPHRGLRGVVRELKTGTGHAPLAEMIRVYLADLKVPVDNKVGILASVGQHAERTAEAGKRRGPLMGEVRSLVSELYDCTRTPTISWPGERIELLVRKIVETQETLKS